MRVAFDSRAVSDPNGVGRYSRCLLKALAETVAAEDELLEAPRPATTVRSGKADVFHSPWMDGAMLHSPCPMVVTVHDLAALKRRSEHLRTGLRLRLRHLAVQRAASVIVPTEAVAADAVEHLHLRRERIVVIPEAADASMFPRSEHEVQQAREHFDLPERYLLWVGDLQHPAPGKQIAKLAAARRELPLVLVGPDAAVGARAARRDPHRPGLRRAARGDLHRRARAGAAIRGRRLRSDGRRGAGLRDAGASPVTHPRCARCSTGVQRSSSPATSTA